MRNIVKTLIVTPIVGFMLSGCSEVTEFFLSEDPQDASSCAYVLNEADAEEGGLLCVECNSADENQASAEACGVEISVRCNSDLDDDIFGIALGGLGEGSSFLTASAWVDSDLLAGPSVDDDIVCHNQSLDGFGKQEWKCTNALKGNGKTATTFEASIKYDASKDDCEAEEA